MLENKKILLLISGGISAVKVPELVSRLKDRGADVCVAITGGAKKFVTPQALSALSGHFVHQDLFRGKSPTGMEHIELSRTADVILVAPATADIMARLAGGRADDLASAVLLASDKPVIMVPAMNVRMWHHPATQRNVAQLRRDGVAFIGPCEGKMACGEFGLGRMVEVDEIIAGVDAHFRPRPLAGRRVVVTSGATREALDPVRFLSNASSGRQGTALANALKRAGAEVHFITGACEVPPPQGVNLLKVESAADMLTAVEGALPADIALFVAAVTDWRVEDRKTQKIKTAGGGENMALKLVKNVDILHHVAHKKKDRPTLVIGFAAETDRLAENAAQKLKRKGCDWIIGNDVSPASGVMGGEENEVLLLKRGQKEQVWPRMTKAQTADRIVDEIIRELRLG